MYLASLAKFLSRISEKYTVQRASIIMAVPITIVSTLAEVDRIIEDHCQTSVLRFVQYKKETFGNDLCGKYTPFTYRLYRFKKNILYDCVNKLNYKHITSSMDGGTGYYPYSALYYATPN